MTDVKRIESYGLFDFCKDIEAAFYEGYTFDFETNENFPTAYGTMLTCGLVKLDQDAETETEEETVTQTEQIAEIVQDVEQTATEVEEVATEAQEVAEAAPAKRGPKSKAK
jgi:hypothetical protein